MLHIKRYGNIGDQSCIVSESLRMHLWIIIKFTLFTCLSLYEGRYFLIIIMEKNVFNVFVEHCFLYFRE